MLGELQRGGDKERSLSLSGIEPHSRRVVPDPHSPILLSLVRGLFLIIRQFLTAKSVLHMSNALRFNLAAPHFDIPAGNVDNLELFQSVLN
jgi:hypothetical protein